MQDGDQPNRGGAARWWPVVVDGGCWVRHLISLTGGREGGSRRHKSPRSRLLSAGALGPGESSGGESGDALETGSNRGTLVRGGRHTSHLQSARTHS